MIISIEGVVWFIIYLLGCGAIFGLLLYLVNYVEQNFPMMQPFAKFARIALVVLAILVLIGIILAVMGHPIVRVQ
jgi:hypothetical protein